MDPVIPLLREGIKSLFQGEEFLSKSRESWLFQGGFVAFHGTAYPRRFRRFALGRE
ncbi:MAG: hypothetical protein MUO50_18880 [Longimicrobiales bacterium]|nr:hypothetical protein [Longimicrobiales bacterium]